MRLLNKRLPASALATETAGLVAVVCLALVARAVLPLSAWYPVKAGALFSIVMALALGHVRGHHPFAQFGSANQVTTVRAILVVLVASLIGEPSLPPVAATASTVCHGTHVITRMHGSLCRCARADDRASHTSVFHYSDGSDGLLRPLLLVPGGYVAAPGGTPPLT